MDDTHGNRAERLSATFGTGTLPPEAPVFVISVAADLAGMHPQTLRQYDRLGLVTPQRTRGGGRRYSPRDVNRLREVQRLSQEGVSLPGIKRIMDLENQVDALRARVSDLTAELEQATILAQTGSRVFAAGLAGDVVVMPPGTRPTRTTSRGQLVLWAPRPDAASATRP